ARRSQRARADLRELDREVQARRLPRRHRAARQCRLLAAVGPQDDLGREEGRREELPDLRRGADREHNRPVAVRPRPRNPQRARLPIPGRRDRLRVGRLERPRDAAPAAGRRLLPHAGRRGRHAADVPRQPRHGTCGVRDRLAGLREANPALATGWTIPRYAKGGVLVVSRIDPVTRQEYVEAFNNGAAPATVSIQTSTYGSWTTLLGPRGLVGSIASGKLFLT